MLRLNDDLQPLARAAQRLGGLAEVEVTREDIELLEADALDMHDAFEVDPSADQAVQLSTYLSSLADRVQEVWRSFCDHARFQSDLSAFLEQRA